MLAYAEGKDIEFFIKGKTYWEKCFTPLFDWDYCKYRIKKEPVYRPFKNAEECWQEMQKHQPFGWIKKNDSFLNIIEIHNDGALIGNNYYYPDYKETFANYQFADGTPFGIKEEQL